MLSTARKILPQTPAGCSNRRKQTTLESQATRKAPRTQTHARPLDGKRLRICPELQDAVAVSPGACHISGAGFALSLLFPAENTMPILGREPDLYPEDLFNSSLILPQDESWFAMYTMARREKELMRHLRSLKIAHYGPITAQRTRSPQGRIRTSYVPLFTGYVFVRGDEVQRHDSISTGCVSRCLRVTQPDELIVDLQRIRMMLQQGQDVRPEPRPVVGRSAVIRRGAMTGMRGIVTKIDNAHRLTVIVNFMQQGASMLVDEADVDLE